MDAGDNIRVELVRRRRRGAAPAQAREALDALQQIVNTAFRRELKDDRSFVVDCMDYRKAKDAELRQMARFMMEKAKTAGPAGDGTAESLRAPPRAPHRGRRSADVVGEHRRRVPEDGHHFRRGGEWRSAGRDRSRSLT